MWVVRADMGDFVGRGEGCILLFGGSGSFLLALGSLRRMSSR